MSKMLKNHRGVAALLVCVLALIFVFYFTRGGVSQTAVLEPKQEQVVVEEEPKKEAVVKKENVQETKTAVISETVSADTKINSQQTTENTAKVNTNKTDTKPKANSHQTSSTQYSVSEEQPVQTSTAVAQPQTSESLVVEQPKSNWSDVDYSKIKGFFPGIKIDDDGFEYIGSNGNSIDVYRVTSKSKVVEYQLTIGDDDSDVIETLTYDDLEKILFAFSGINPKEIRDYVEGLQFAHKKDEPIKYKDVTVYYSSSIMEKYVTIKPNE